LIAKRYGTTVSLLRKTNRIRGTRIRAGRHLIIPVSTRSLASYTLTSEQRQKSIQRKTSGSGKKIVHTVRKGDNLWDISRQYKVSVRRLAKWNGIAPRDMLQLGQKLVVWVKSAASATASAIRGLNLTGPDRTTKVNYVVRRGDSLSRISNKFRVTIRQLRKWNRLKSKYLQPGQRITVYVDITRQS
ncbi:MAG: LysM peptidoglycan-binding domain-containing protein, partial [Gammaproteobacteria bacterium]|nr:LysM peptidoglycan-binding domain-containing protein [Gammaproteobacteria bacterium]